MKRSEPKLLVDIINEALRRDGLQTEFNEQRALYLWPQVVGPGVNRYTTRRFMDHGVMHVFISSATLKNDLSFMRPRLIEALNQLVGANTVTDIVLH
jgi:hypothetical protein